MTVLDTIPRAKVRADADYLALVERFPLRAIASDRELDEAMAVIDKLVGFELTKGQAQYLDALATLVEKYESEHVPDLKRSTPAEMLKALMENRGISQKVLGKLVGESSASMLLKGSRNPSKEQAKKLAKFFRVDAGVFL